MTESQMLIRRVGFGVVALTCVTWTGACRGPKDRALSGPTRADTLIQVYPELQAGRFVVIADFEDPKHMDLFRLIGVSEQAKCVLDRKGGRAETGAACLQLTTGSSEDTVVLANNSEAQWYLKRDWRPYDLLLLSVYAPKRDLALDVTIGSGPAEQRVSAQSSMALQRGWNGLRIDLAEVGEQVPLDDVREVRLAVSGVSKPVELRFDDILLTGNRVDLVGDSRASTGALYVQQVGRRWNVGAGGRFELTFANGQITNGYNLAADPNRLRNLVQGTTLGPSPVVMGGSGPEVGDFSPLGKSVVARQRIVEMNAVRAVVASEWRFVDDPDAPLEGRPFQRWVYTVYPSGQVFVAVEATAATKSWSPPGLGLAVTLASPVDDPWQTQIATAGDGAEQPSTPVYATARSRPRDTLLLYMVHPAGGGSRIVEQADAHRRRVSLVGTQERAPGEMVKWACQLVLAPSEEVSQADVAARAVEYSQSAPIRLEVGSPVTDGGASRRGDGFEPSTGTHDLTPDQDRVRFVVDGQKHPVFSPAFRILGAKDREAWVYVNHLILSKVARDSGGNLVFQLPGTIRRSTLVEVLLRRPGS
jgi:hypothetical protein